MKVAPKIKKVPFNDRSRIKALIYEVFEDTWKISYSLIDGVDEMELDETTNTLFTLTLVNKIFEFEEIKIDNNKDYMDVYLQGLLINPNRYDVTTSDNNIIITFNESITLSPEDILISEFLVKGKIVDISIATEDDLILITEDYLDIII